MRLKTTKSPVKTGPVFDGGNDIVRIIFARVTDVTIDLSEVAERPALTRPSE
jgi:hypothetical protein